MIQKFYIFLIPTLFPFFFYLRSILIFERWNVENHCTNECNNSTIIDRHFFCFHDDGRRRRGNVVSCKSDLSQYEDNKQRETWARVAIPHGRNAAVYWLTIWKRIRKRERENSVSSFTLSNCHALLQQSSRAASVAAPARFIHPTTVHTFDINTEKKHKQKPPPPLLWFFHADAAAARIPPRVIAPIQDVKNWTLLYAQQ
jgi:hypothetical protein